MITNSVFLIIIVSIIVIPVVVLSLFVAALLGFHVYLMIQGRTTKETLTKSDCKKTSEMTLVLPSSHDLRAALFTGVRQEDEDQEQKKPYLCFALPLLKEEVDYLTEYDFCSSGQMGL